MSNRRNAYADAVVDGYLYGKAGKRIVADAGNSYAVFQLPGDVQVLKGDVQTSEFLAGERVVVSRIGKVKASGTVVIDGIRDDAWLVTGNMKHRPVRDFIVTPAEMVEISRKIGWGLAYAELPDKFELCHLSIIGPPCSPPGSACRNRIEECELSLSNREVHIAFEKIIRGWFGRSGKEYDCLTLSEKSA